MRGSCRGSLSVPVPEVRNVHREECSIEALAAVLREAGPPCPETALPGLAAYVATLMRWNRVMNLVGARTWRDAARDLVSDCLRLAAFLRALPLPAQPLCADLGSGAGLPGIPLRLVWQEGAYHMVELRRKRALFLAQVLGTLNLPRTQVHNVDARDFLAGHGVDLVVSRAFLPWDKVLAMVGAHMHAGGHAVFMANAVPSPDEVAKASPGFTLTARESYMSMGRRRHFWAARRGDGA